MEDTSGPSFIKLSRGAASRGPDGWRFVCPVAWGGPDTPLMGATAAPPIWIGARTGLQEWSASGTLLHTHSDLLNAAELRALVHSGTRMFALSGFGDTSTVWSLVAGQAPQSVHKASHRIQSMSTDWEGRLLIVLIEEENFVIERVDPSDGSVTRIHSSTSLPVDGTLTLRSTPGGIYVRTINQSIFRLYRIEEEDGQTLLYESTDSIHGPHQINERTWLTTEGQLTELVGDTLIPNDNTRRISCLSPSPTYGLIACVLPDLYAVSPEGELAQPLFELATLLPPVWEHLETNAAIQCELEWLDFSADGGIAQGLTPPADPADGPDPVNRSGGDCGITPRPQKNVWVLTLLFSVFLGVAHSRRVKLNPAKARTRFSRSSASAPGPSR